jgi:hypothetical protein
MRKEFFKLSLDWFSETLWLKILMKNY